MSEAPRRMPVPARPSTATLPSVPSVVPPWPGEPVPVRGGEVFVRHTPWTGPVDGGPQDVIPGDGAPRERALYVHGLGGASTNWTDLAGLLAVRFDGWALDLPGFGRSEPPARGGYAIQRHARAVVDVLERVAQLPGPASGRPVHLLGNSLGGLISLLAAARCPDLVGSLTLISPAMPVYRVPPAFDRAVPLLLVPGIATVAGRRLAAVSPEQQVKALVEMCFGDPLQLPRERWELAVEEARERVEQQWAGRALTLSMRGLLASYLRIGRAGAWRLAAAVDRPTLVVWGDRDRLVDPRLAPRLAETMPDARLLVLEGVGHVAQIEAPEPTARAVLGLAEDVAGGLPAAAGPPARAAPAAGPSPARKATGGRRGGRTAAAAS